MTTAARTPVAELTEGQLYDEANSVMWARHHGKGTTDAQEARLEELEAEFWKRHALALAA
jgi:hypothetical protein